MSNDIDFEQFIQLLDGALASDDKNVKQALRKFLFVAAMVMGDDTEPGPFTQMMDTIDSLQQRLAQLEAQLSSTTSGQSTWTYPNWGTTNIGTGTGISSTGTVTGAATSGSIAGTGSATFTNPTGNTGTITLPNATTTAVSGTYQFTGGSTTNMTWDDFNDPKTGTNIKEEIKEGLDKLAKSA